jgi:hypothetical protein
MAHETVQMTTYSCDIPNCEEEQTIGGSEPGETIIDMGWELDHPFFDKPLDLCPNHVKFLKEFVGVE